MTVDRQRDRGVVHKSIRSTFPTPVDFIFFCVLNNVGLLKCTEDDTAKRA
jgi:hypothetical protein